ncbi:hypothetical protein C8F01DRAFT_1093005 [Mycena amicta]|nr:hypothetical protein C8F01DRAFT_1093005 [Mycena amicta]
MTRKRFRRSRESEDSHETGSQWLGSGGRQTVVVIRDVSAKEDCGDNERRRWATEPKGHTYGDTLASRTVTGAISDLEDGVPGAGRALVDTLFVRGRACHALHKSPRLSESPDVIRPRLHRHRRTCSLTQKSMRYPCPEIEHLNGIPMQIEIHGVRKVGRTRARMKITSEGFIDGKAAYEWWTKRAIPLSRGSETEDTKEAVGSHAWSSGVASLFTPTPESMLAVKTSSMLLPHRPIDSSPQRPQPHRFVASGVVADSSDCRRHRGGYKGNRPASGYNDKGWVPGWASRAMRRRRKRLSEVVLGLPKLRVAAQAHSTASQVFSGGMGDHHAGRAHNARPTQDALQGTRTLSEPWWDASEMELVASGTDSGDVVAGHSEALLRSMYDSGNISRPTLYQPAARQHAPFPLHHWSGLWDVSRAQTGRPAFGMSSGDLMHARVCCLSCRRNTATLLPRTLNTSISTREDLPLRPRLGAGSASRAYSATHPNQQRAGLSTVPKQSVFDELGVATLVDSTLGQVSDSMCVLVLEGDLASWVFQSGVSMNFNGTNAISFFGGPSRAILSYETALASARHAARSMNTYLDSIAALVSSSLLPYSALVQHFKKLGS